MAKVYLNDRDIRLLENAANQYLSDLGSDNLLLKIECYNEQEAIAYKDYLEANYPQIKTHFSWLNFSRLQQIQNQPNKVSSPTIPQKLSDYSDEVLEKMRDWSQESVLCVFDDGKVRFINSPNKEKT